MGLVDDPISGTIGTLLQHGLEKNLFKLVRLTYACGLAAGVAFLVVAGGGLAALQPTAQAIGLGMVAAGVAIFATYKVSDDAKDIKIAVLDKVAQEVENNPTTEVKR